MLYLFGLPSDLCPCNTVRGTCKNYHGNIHISIASILCSHNEETAPTVLCELSSRFTIQLTCLTEESGICHVTSRHLVQLCIISSSHPAVFVTCPTFKRVLTHMSIYVIYRAVRTPSLGCPLRPIDHSANPSFLFRLCWPCLTKATPEPAMWPR